MFNRKLLVFCFLLNKKNITPADLAFGNGDGVFESGCAAAAFLTGDAL